jgi:alpha-D-ribose 1-methylphosphonate 5-triphosphate synthase subunit PhnH
MTLPVNKICNYFEQNSKSDRLLASGTSSASLYDDDGETFGYQRGEKAVIAVSVTRSSQTTTVKVGTSNGTYTGKPSTQTYILKVNLVDGTYGSVLNGGVVFTKLADAATILGASAPDNSWALDAAAGIVYARFTTSTSVANEITFNAGNGDYLGLDKAAIAIPVVGGSANAGVVSNVTWTVANPASSWLTVSPTSGSGNATLSVQAASNPALTARTATVTLSGGAKSASVALTQAGLGAENIAKGKPVTASSVESTQVPIANAVDDSATTRWASVWSDPQWIAVDLGAVYQIAKVELLWEAAYAKSYKIQVSVDNATWSDIYSTTNGQGGTESLLVTGRAHYIRMYGSVRATTYGYSLWEFRVFGALEIPSSLNVTPSSLAFGSGGGSSTVALASNVAWTVVDIPGWLTVAPASGSNNSTLSFNASANTGLARTATVNVVGGGITCPVSVGQAALPNTPPTISTIVNQTVFLNSATGAIGFTVGDAETPAAALTLVASSDTPSLVPPENMVFAGSGANRTVTITPAAGQAGTATVGIQVRDTNGGTAATQFAVTVRSPNAILDRNGDGISDVWAALYPTAGAPAADPDGDGQSNLAEAQAGTDPTNSSSRFIATARTDAAGNLVVSWTGFGGKYYFVETSTDLITWLPLATEYTGTGTELSAIVRPAGTSSAARTFWHVVVFDIDSSGSGLNDWEKTHPEVVASITASAGANGRVSPSGRCYIARGGSLTFTVTPAVGYAIDQVQVDGQSVGAVSTYPFPSITADHTIAATFKSSGSLSAYPKQLSFPTGGGAAPVTVTSDIAWTATSNQAWLSVVPAGASGNGTLTLTVPVNTGVERTATLTLQGAGITRQIPVYQVGLPTVYVRNRWKNTFMYDAGDRVGYGAAPVDDTYRWLVEDVGNGQKELRNVGTGEYINVEGHQDWAQCTPRQTTWQSSKWTLEDTGDGYVRFRNVWLTSNYLHVENQTGYVQEGTGCATCLSNQWVMEPVSSEYGTYFSKKAYVPVALPSYAVDRNRLPNPILGSNQNWIDMYWKCWEIAYRGLRQPVAGSPLVSNWQDEAFSGNIFQWDTIFMMMFARYGHEVFPAIQSLDNFYARQTRSGYICREIRESDGAFIHYDFSGGLFSPTGWKNTINPPLFSWAEVESYRVTGDKSRFAMILPALEKYSEWLNRDGDPDAADWEANGRLSAGTVHRLFWNTPLGCGMDNTPRPAEKGAGWVEMSSQMVIMYNNMATICDELGQAAEAAYFRAQATAIGSRINQWCWNEADGFYYDVLANGQHFKKKTIGGFWPLLAGVPSAAQAAKLVAHLQNPNQFWRLNVFPSLSADEPEYPGDGLGGYWRGGVWAPTNVMVIKGLERYGYEDLAAAATEKYLAGMAEVFRTTNTVYENYAPDKYAPGNPAAADFVGWTGCGPIQLLFEQVMGLRPDGIRSALTWRLRRTDRHGVERLKLGSNMVSVVCEARTSASAPAIISVQCQAPFQLIVVHPSLGTRTFNCIAGANSLTFAGPGP